MAADPTQAEDLVALAAELPLLPTDPATCRRAVARGGRLTEAVA